MASTSQLNIKNPEARKLALELARVTGQSVTQAVTQAMRETLERETRRRGRDEIARQLMEIGERAAALPVLDPRSPDDMLYDEDGLPK